MAKKIFFILLMITLLIGALPATAETLELKCDYESGCDLCDAVALIAKISKFILSITGSLALLIFVLGGLFLLISQGNSQAVNQGKKMLVGAVLGLIIIFAAWGIVNLVITVMTDQISDKEVKVAQLFTKPWNEIECVKPPKPKPPAAGEETAIGAGNCGGLTTSGIKISQCSDASAALNQLLKCINDHYREYGVWDPPIITSICDDKGCERCRTAWQPPPSCSHSETSYHYCLDGSHAADFRSTGYDDMQWGVFQMLVSDCGGRVDWENKGSKNPNKPEHFHTEIRGGCQRN